MWVSRRGSGEVGRRDSLPHEYEKQRCAVAVWLPRFPAFPLPCLL
jgi:hypothetical protein